MRTSHLTASFIALTLLAASAFAQVAIKADTLHTMGPQGTITAGVVIVDDKGKITAVGPAASTPIPAGYKTITAKVLTPGLIDARCAVGLSGIFNTKHDSDQIERSAPIQPELRAIDAYNPQEPLIDYVRSYGVTTIHTGHVPGELISGQTLIAKTRGLTAEQAAIVPTAMIAATFSPQAEKDGAKSPGSRGKMMALLRQELIKAREYADRRAKGDAKPAELVRDADHKDGKPDPDAKPRGRDLRMEMLERVLKGELPLIITAHRASDIGGVLRLKDEFKINVILDGGSEAYLLIDQLKAANVPVILHPSMQRSVGETENASFTTAAKLADAGLTVTLQGGYEAYVPKARVILFEAAIAASHGLGPQRALKMITLDAAKILGIDKRVGSIEPGKDGDLALYDGDPFEYTTHCTGVFIEGKQVSDVIR